MQKNYNFSTKKMFPRMACSMSYPLAFQIYKQEMYQKYAGMYLLNLSLWPMENW